MNADDIQTLFINKKSEYAVIAFVDGNKLTANELTVVDSKSILVNKRFLVNLDNVKFVRFASDEFEASN
jgi:hypothetical protein